MPTLFCSILPYNFSNLIAGIFASIFIKIDWPKFLPTSNIPWFMMLVTFTSLIPNWSMVYWSQPVLKNVWLISLLLCCSLHIQRYYTSRTWAFASFSYLNCLFNFQFRVTKFSCITSMIVWKSSSPIISHIPSFRPVLIHLIKAFASARLLESFPMFSIALHINSYSVALIIYNRPRHPVPPGLPTAAPLKINLI